MQAIEYKNSERINLCSLLLIILGIVGCIYALLGSVIPTAMPDSIGAYYIRDLFERPTSLFGPPAFVLTIGLVYIVFGAIAIYINYRVHSCRAIKIFGIAFRSIFTHRPQ